MEPWKYLFCYLSKSTSLGFLSVLTSYTFLPPHYVGSNFWLPSKTKWSKMIMNHGKVFLWKGWVERNGFYTVKYDVLLHDFIVPF